MDARLCLADAFADLRQRRCKLRSQSRCAGLRKSRAQLRLEGGPVELGFGEFAVQRLQPRFEQRNAGALGTGLDWTGRPGTCWSVETRTAFAGRLLGGSGWLEGRGPAAAETGSASDGENSKTAPKKAKRKYVFGGIGLFLVGAEEPKERPRLSPRASTFIRCALETN